MESSEEGTRGAVPDAAAGERIGRFLVVDTIGQGAMGVVVRAFDPRLERMIAIKLVNPECSERVGLARKRLVAEARALARLSHPNVVAVYEVGVHEGHDYVAMELVDGIDLQRWLRARPRHWREIVAVFAAAAEGLHAAHLAGLVHRDVKPANIFIGRDGQARVGDFGIARASDAASGSGPGGSEAVSQPERERDEAALTQPGRVMGTPIYMAPEQHAGGQLGPAADQYALCVSLFQALWDRPPFLVPPAKLAAAKRNPPRAPPRRGVPRWLFEVVVRGLHPDPGARHASCHALARALRRTASTRMTAAAVVMGCAAAASLALVTTREEPCTGGRARIAEIWGPDARASIARTFTESTRPYATHVWSEVSARVDDYASRWIELHTDACEATRGRDEQSDDLLDRRMTCLSRRRDHLVATLALLEEGGDATVDSAVSLVGRLPELAPCAETGAEVVAIAPPEDPAMRARVDATRGELARARARYDAGQYEEALTLADRTAAEAREIGYEPLLVETLWVRGDALLAVGRPEEARADLREATWTAIAIGHDTVAVESAASLVWLESEHVRDFDAAAEWVEVARSELRRSGSPAITSARVANVIGVSMANVGRWDDALAEYEHARSLVENHPGQADLAHVLQVNIANVYLNRGDGGRARAIYAAQVEAMEALLGHDHPKVSFLRHMLSDSLSEIGEDERAIALGEAAVASLHRIYGEHGNQLAGALMGLAITYGRAGRRDEARALCRRAHDLFEAVGDRAGVAIALANIGSLDVERGAYDSAEVALDQALALERELYGTESGGMVYPLIDKITILRAQGRLDEAEALALQAQRIATAALDPLAHEGIVARQVRQGILADQGRLEESVALGRESLDLALRSDDVRVATRPLARSELAIVLVRTGAPDEALVLLDEALDELGTRDPEHRIDVTIERAVALLALGRETEARADLELAIAEADRGEFPDSATRARALLSTLATREAVEEPRVQPARSR